MNGTLANIGLVVVFVLIGGVFAAAEIALVSLRDSQVRGLAGQSKRGKTVAELNEDPNRFLAAVQIGVTLAGFLSAAFGASAFADDLAPVLRGWGIPRDAADPGARDDGARRDRPRGHLFGDLSTTLGTPRSGLWKPSELTSGSSG